MVRFEFELFIFFAGKSTVGAVLGSTALTNTRNCPYRSPLQGRLILPAATPAAPTEATSVGTPWEGRLAQPPLQRF